MSIAKEVYNITQFLKSTLTNSGQKGFALGLSGGIDSAVCAALAMRAINELNDEPAQTWLDMEHQRRVYTLDLMILPMGNHHTDAGTAEEVAAAIGADVRTIELGDALRTFYTALLGGPYATLVTSKDGHKYLGNIKARMRMTAIYFSANANNLLVLGTDNLTETYTGYFTKHGDGAADVFPLSDFTKREVYELGRFLKLPESVLTRAPSAGLWEGQTDEGEMGVPYDYIDNQLEGLDGLNHQMYTGDQNHEYRRRLNALHHTTAHKRAAPHIYSRKAK